MENNTEVQKKQLYRRLTNIFLLVFSIIMIFYGLYIQIHYHIQKEYTSGFSQWTFIHKWSALLFTLIVVIHVVLHRKWYKTVLKKRLFKKNRVTLILSVSMLIVSLLGFAPWIVSSVSSNLEPRHTFIEIHDKIGVFFMVIMIGHITKRYKWGIKLCNLHNWFSLQFGLDIQMPFPKKRSRTDNNHSLTKD